MARKMSLFVKTIANIGTFFCAERYTLRVQEEVKLIFNFFNNYSLGNGCANTEFTVTSLASLIKEF